MKAKTKVILNYPRLAYKMHRAKKIAKKIRKDGIDGTRYPEQWRNDYVVKTLTKVTKLINVEVEVIGWENLPKAPAIIAPNHSSLWDPALIMIALKDVRPGNDYKNIQSVFLAKKEIAKNRRTKGFTKITNTFYIDRKNPRASLKAMDEFAQYSKDKKKMAVVFPEGTRTKDGNINEFKAGAFRMAKKTFVPIVPTTINNAFSISNLSRSKKLKVQVIFGKPMKPMSFISYTTKDLAAKVQKEVQRNFVKPEGKRSKKGASLAN